jgi:hypothetical protein
MTKQKESAGAEKATSAALAHILDIPEVAELWVKAEFCCIRFSVLPGNWRDIVADAARIGALATGSPKGYGALSRSGDQPWEKETKETGACMAWSTPAGVVITQ